MSTQGSQPQERPLVVESYYKARWGHADEFIDLVRKNHWPVLKKQIEGGRILRVTAARPRYHTTEEGRWDYRITIVFRDVRAAHEHADEGTLKRELFPIRRPSDGKNSGGSRSCWPTGTSRSRTWTWTSSGREGRDHHTTPICTLPK